MHTTPKPLSEGCTNGESMQPNSTVSSDAGKSSALKAGEHKVCIRMHLFQSISLAIFVITTAETHSYCVRRFARIVVQTALPSGGKTRMTSSPYVMHAVSMLQRMDPCALQVYGDRRKGCHPSPEIQQMMLS